MRDIQVKQNPDKPVDPIVLADAIVSASDSMKRLLSSGLNRRAIIILISTDTGFGQRQVGDFLNSLENLAARYTTRKV